MQNAKRSLLSFLLSAAIHIAIIVWLFDSHVNTTDTSANSATGEISTSISMEMMMAMVEADPPPVEEKWEMAPAAVSLMLIVLRCAVKLSDTNAILLVRK